MNFENIVIFPPDDYRFLNFVPRVINLHFQIAEKFSIFFSKMHVKKTHLTAIILIWDLRDMGFKGGGGGGGTHPRHHVLQSVLKSI